MFIKYNAPEEQTVDFFVADDVNRTSEYQQLVQEVEPLLVNVTIPGLNAPTIIDKLAVVKKHEVDFLNDETGIERQKIEFLVGSSIMQKKVAMLLETKNCQPCQELLLMIDGQIAEIRLDKIRVYIKMLHEKLYSAKHAVTKKKRWRIVHKS